MHKKIAFFILLFILFSFTATAVSMPRCFAEGDSEECEKCLDSDGREVDMALCKKCIDSDGGKNVFESGRAGSIASGAQLDWCEYSRGMGSINEAYCLNEEEYASEKMFCPSEKPFCNKGACSSEKPRCIENDNGRNPLAQGTTFSSFVADHRGHTDYCRQTSTGAPYDPCSGPDCSLREFYCMEDYPDGILTDIPCPNGCENGVCANIDEEDYGPMPTTPSQEQGSYATRTPEQLETPISEELKNFKKVVVEPTPSQVKTSKFKSLWKEEVYCNGCLLEETCYPISYRVESEYCDKNGFLVQKETDAVCNNSFECTSNLCIDNKCVSADLWQKIVRLFTRLFNF